MNRYIGEASKSRIDADLDDEDLDDDLDEDLDEDEDPSDDTTVVLDETGAFTDNVGDVSVEINVEELVAELEGLEDKDVARKKEIRRRLEELAEGKDLDDTYAIEFDD